MGSALSILAVLSPFANCIGENYYFLFLNSGITDEQGIFYSGTTDFIAAAFSLGLISGIGGAIAFAISTGASCRTFPERFLKLLGGAYLVLAVTSILMLVALASFPAQCNVLLLWGGAFAIVAFFLYLGAGIFTIGMIKKKDVNRASVCTCCPYGNLTALPSVFGFIGAVLILLAILPFEFLNYPATNLNYPSENIELSPSSSPLSPAYSPIDALGGCRVYSSKSDGLCSLSLLGAEDDPPLTFSFVMGIIAGGVCLVVSVISIIPGCQKVPSKAFQYLGSTYILLGLMCLLTLVAFASKECAGECLIGTGGILAICAFFMFMAAGLSAFYLTKISSQVHM
jgi:hypothetical protein